MNLSTIWLRSKNESKMCIVQIDNKVKTELAIIRTNLITTVEIGEKKLLELTRKKRLNMITTKQAIATYGKPNQQGSYLTRKGL